MAMFYWCVISGDNYHEGTLEACVTEAARRESNGVPVAIFVMDEGPICSMRILYQSNKPLHTGLRFEVFPASEPAIYRPCRCLADVYVILARLHLAYDPHEYIMTYQHSIPDVGYPSIIITVKFHQPETLDFDWSKEGF